jgi:lysyl-tRNA synthetase class 2
MVETMTAYENYEYNMNLIEDLFRHVAEKVFNKTEFSVRGHTIDFGNAWKRISMADAVLEETGIDFRICESLAQANAHLESLGIREPQESIGLALAKAFEAKVEQTLISPTFIFGHPMEISPLAKPTDSDPRFAERFEIFIAGMECGDNWSEQNDPVALLERWKSRYKSQEETDEFHPLDYDFIEVLEYGMPPTTGIGPGIERMAMIFTDEENIDNVIFFPMMKPVLSPTNAVIYEIDALPSVSKGTEDVLVSMQEFVSLVEDGILRPETPDILIHPYLRIWDRPTAEGRWRASGYLEVNGFLVNKQLRIVGFAMESDEKLNAPDAASGYVAAVREAFDQIAQEYFGDSKVEIDDRAHVIA